MTLVVTSSAVEVRAITTRLIEKIRLECESLQLHTARGSAARGSSKRLAEYAQMAEEDMARAFEHEPMLDTGEEHGKRNQQGNAAGQSG